MNKNTSGEIVFYQHGDSPAIEVRLDGETVWLTQDQMAELFGKAKSTINEHIKNIFEEGELLPGEVMRKFGNSEFSTKPTNLYNLDVIISVGYRVKSQQGTQFRIWATKRLREYLIKGFTMDDDRLKHLGGGIYWKELLDRIRDIRSSEKVLYRQVLDLYATSVNYDPKAEASLVFFKTVQNKLHYAAHGKTAAEVIAERADANSPSWVYCHFLVNIPPRVKLAMPRIIFMQTNSSDSTPWFRLTSMPRSFVRWITSQLTCRIGWYIWSN